MALPHPAPDPDNDHTHAATVPLAVWSTPTATGEPTRPLPRALAARLVAAFTPPGGTITTLQPDLHLVAAAADLGRRTRHDHTSRNGGDGGDLVLHTVQIAADRRSDHPGEHLIDGAQGEVLSYGRAFALLRPGGICVTVLAASPARHPHLHGQHVDAARAHGFGYLQHIVAVTSPIRGSRLDPPGDPDDMTDHSTDGVRTDSGHSGHTRPFAPLRRVHADVLVFLRPGQQA